MIKTVASVKLSCPQNKTKQNKELKSQSPVNFTSNQNLHSSSAALSSVGKAQVVMNKNKTAFKGQVVSYSAEAVTHVGIAVGAHMVGGGHAGAHGASHRVHEGFRDIHKATKKFDKQLVKDIKKLFE